MDKNVTSEMARQIAYKLERSNVSAFIPAIPDVLRSLADQQEATAARCETLEREASLALQNGAVLREANDGLRETIQRGDKAFNELRQRLAASEGAGWVKCSERMPDVGVSVRIYVPIMGGGYDGHRIKARNGMPAGWWTYVGELHEEAASHWQPLPPAPPQSSR